MKAYPQTFLELSEKRLTVLSDDNGTVIAYEEEERPGPQDKKQRTRFLDGADVRITSDDQDDRTGVVVEDCGDEGVRVTLDGHESFRCYCHSRVSLL